MPYLKHWRPFAPRLVSSNLTCEAAASPPSFAPSGDVNPRAPPFAVAVGASSAHASRPDGVFDAAASRSERERFFVATSEAGASSGASPASIDYSVVAVPFQMLKSED